MYKYTSHTTTTTTAKHATEKDFPCCTGCCCFCLCFCLWNLYLFRHALLRVNVWMEKKKKKSKNEGIPRPSYGVKLNKIIFPSGKLHFDWNNVQVELYYKCSQEFDYQFPHFFPFVLSRNVSWKVNARKKETFKENLMKRKQIGRQVVWSTPFYSKTSPVGLHLHIFRG